MPRVKADADVIKDEKPGKPPEGKSLESEKEAPKTVQNAAGKNAGKGTPMPQMQTPAAEPKRVSVKFTDGKIDIDALGPENAAIVQVGLKNSVADPKIRKWAGMSAADPVTGIEVKLPPEIAGAALDVIPLGVSFALAKQTGLRVDQIHPLVKWDTTDHGILDKQFALLAEKYMPESWKQYSDVGIFCLTLVTLLKMKAAAVEKLAKAEIEKIGKADKATFSQPLAPAPATPEPKPMIVPKVPLPPPAAPGGSGPESRSLE